MENATQALFIATGVLIGIVILSLAVYLGNVMGGFAADTQKQIDESQLGEFNSRFLKYDEQTNLTIQDVITVKNYALESNQRTYSGYDYKTDRAGSNNDFIDVFYDDDERAANTIIYTLYQGMDADEELLKSSIDKKFSCKVEVNTSTGRVNKIYFHQTEEEE